MRAEASVESAVLTVKAAAFRCGMTERALRGCVARRLIPFRKIGAKVIFLASELDAWMASLPGCTLAEAERNLAIRRGEEITVR